MRSEGEYAKGHIPGAINMPLFSNEERAIVGTLYKQTGLAQMVRQALEIAGTNPKIALYCWRGGMHSGSMAWLLETAVDSAYSHDLEKVLMQNGIPVHSIGILQAAKEKLIKIIM